MQPLSASKEQFFPKCLVQECSSFYLVSSFEELMDCVMDVDQVSGQGMTKFIIRTI
jgi:hypothetical protein